MALIGVAATRIAVGFLGCWLAMTPALAAPDAAPAPGAGLPDVAATEPAKDEAIVYIFSGALTGGETYSGTLVAATEGPEFELKLGRGATCDNSKLDPDKGLLRLPERPCSDGRKLKALFVYQQGGVLRVYGSVDEERFSTEAHALPSDAPEAVPTKPAAPPADLMQKTK